MCFSGLLVSDRRTSRSREFVVKCYFELRDPVLCFPLFPAPRTVANRRERGSPLCSPLRFNYELYLLLLLLSSLVPVQVCSLLLT